VGGQKGRGLGGRNFCPPTSEAKPRRPARSEQRPAKKFSFPFRRKKLGADKRKAEKTFLRGGERQRAAAGRSESVGILFKMSSDFFQQTPLLRQGFAVLALHN